MPNIQVDLASIIGSLILAAVLWLVRTVNKIDRSNAVNVQKLSSFDRQLSVHELRLDAHRNRIEEIDKRVHHMENK